MSRSKLTYFYTNGLIYNGSGLILLEMHYNRKTKKYIPSVLLFKGFYDNLYQNLGGKIDKKDLLYYHPIVSTALREGVEESLNTIVIPEISLLEKMEYIDSQLNNIYYREYLICLPPSMFQRKYFFQNKKIIDKLNVSSAWKEMIDVKRFYLKDLIKCSQEESNECIDINEKSCFLRPDSMRSFKTLASKYDNLINDILNKPINFKLTENYGKYGFTSLVYSSN